MLKRKIYDQLLSWKNNPDKMCLLVHGARQVGKTTIVEKFARENYENYVYINFDENPSHQQMFEEDFDVDVLIKQITLRIPRAKLIPGKSLLFLDEIQSCPRARTALKFFSIAKKFDVIASGSMLGLGYKDVPSYPVGYEDHLDMYSMDFEEFLWSNGVSEESISVIREYYLERKPLPEAMHQKMMEHFKEYIVVGGMPRVVSEFVNTKNYGNVLSLQRGIVRGYHDDIAKYAEGAEKAKAKACFLSIPKQLSKDYKKFQYSVVEKKGTSRKFGGSLVWLHDAGIINYCYNLAAPELPLEGNARFDAFKVYMRDTGLLMSMLEDGSQKDIIDGNLGIYKGAIYENIIADIFAKAGKKLYYFERKGNIEIDFFIRMDGKATAVEVKSADNTKAKSMKTIIQDYGVKQGILLSSRNVEHGQRILRLPIYMAMFL